MSKYKEIEKRLVLFEASKIENCYGNYDPLYYSYTHYMLLVKN